MTGSNSMLPEDGKLQLVTLDFEQRKRAHALEGLVIEEALTAAFEIIHLRDQLKRRDEAIKAAMQYLGNP